MYLWKQTQKRVKTFIAKRPFMAFFVVLGILFGLIVIGNVIRKPAAQKAAAQPVLKSVEIFSNTDAPTVTLQAKIEKTGALSIYAQSAGVVQAIRVASGAHVGRGTQLFSLSTNYQGANAAGVSRTIAQTNYQALLDTYDQQKDLIAKQRSIANAIDSQSVAMRDMSRQSLNDTQALITANQGIVDSLGGQISALQATNVGGSNNATILNLQQAQAGAMSALLQLRSSQRTLSYQTDTSKEPTLLGDAQRDLTLEQLDLQAKALDTGRDIAALNVKLAGIMESLMYPSTPATGTVERVFVHVGQVVNPGTLLASIRADKNEAQAIVLVDDGLATQISSIEPSIFTVAGTSVSVRPSVIAHEPTEAGLHAITYTLPHLYANSVASGSLIPVRLPLATTRTSLVVPLKAVYQTPEKTYVYVVGNQSGSAVAELKEVVLGDVYGEYVPVLSGLRTSDRVILTRSVKEGDRLAL